MAKLHFYVWIYNDTPDSGRYNSFRRVPISSTPPQFNTSVSHKRATPFQPPITPLFQTKNPSVQHTPQFHTKNPSVQNTLQFWGVFGLANKFTVIWIFIYRTSNEFCIISLFSDNFWVRKLSDPSLRCQIFAIRAENPTLQIDGDWIGQYRLPEILPIRCKFKNSTLLQAVTKMSGRKSREPWTMKPYCVSHKTISDKQFFHGTKQKSMFSFLKY